MRIDIEKSEDLSGIKVRLRKDNQIIGRGFLYILRNELHKRPFGFLEDVYIEEEYRGQGFGRKLVQKIIELAREQTCYKLIGTSRYSRSKVHDFYKHLGFKDYGKEFRIDFD